MQKIIGLCNEQNHKQSNGKGRESLFHAKLYVPQSAIITRANLCRKGSKRGGKASFQSVRDS